MKILIDMNLSPNWAEFFAGKGWEAVHWSTIGDPRATDKVILNWAKANGYIVFTHDLDFGALLAVTHAEGPSVIQVRTQDVLTGHIGEVVVATLKQHMALLEIGALIILDENNSRVRILPLKQ